MTDIYVQEHVPDDEKLLTSPEFEPYRLLSSTGLGKYIEALNHNAVGEFIKGEEYIRGGARMGDPYSIYALYKLYASENSLGIEPNKELAWYYLICAAVSFFNSLLYEESPLNLLNCYIEMFDTEDLEKSLKIIQNGIDNDCTPFAEHKELLKMVLLYIMQVKVDTQKQKIIEYFHNKNLVPKEFVLLHLYLTHDGNLNHALQIAMSNKVRAYICSNVKDYILFYNQSGTLGLAGTSVGFYNSIIFAVGYFILMGKGYKEDDYDGLEKLIAELHKFCSILACQEGAPGNQEDVIGSKYLEKLSPLVHGIMIYFYSKGRHISKRLEKAEQYIELDQNLEYESSESFDLNGLRNYLVYVSGYRVFKEKGEIVEGKKMLEAMEKLYTEEVMDENREGLIPVDYYLAGFVQEKLHGNVEKAKEYYLLGTEVSTQAEDYGRIMEYLAFKRKCQSKFTKLNGGAV